jgi:hypothetical protein
MRAARAAADDACMTREDLELFAHVRVAAPCPMKWSEMQGDEKKRLCGQCNLHVHKVSELTTDEAVALFRKVGTERVCAQLFWRLDGTVMTKDCPSAWSVGLSEAVKRVGPATGVVAATLVFVVACVVALSVLFGDNVRRLFGTTAGDLVVAPPITAPSARSTLPSPGPGHEY